MQNKKWAVGNPTFQVLCRARTFTSEASSRLEPSFGQARHRPLDVMTTDWLDLHEQFLLCRDSRRIPEEWSARSIGEWHLGHHPSLPVVTLLARDRVEVGWLLGYAVDGKGVLLDSISVTIPCDRGAEVAVGDLENWVYDHGGRFAVVLLAAAGQRIYLDPCGSLSAVYCPMLECAASTVTAIPHDGDTGELIDLAELVGEPVASMYPLDVTPRKNVRRLLPNHFLDLRRWQVVRHWPTTDTLAVTEIDTAVSRIVERVHLCMEAFVAKMPVLLPLTAGRDSRTLLACARPWIERMRVYTAELGPSDVTSWLDLRVATRIARDAGFRHMRVRHRPPRRADIEHWLLRTGRSVGLERGWRSCTTFNQLPPGHAHLLGMVGELAHGYYWRRNDADRTSVGPDRLLSVFGSRPPPLIRAMVDAWLDSLPCRDVLLTLNLFYLEQRLGCWAGVLPYGYAQDGRFMIFPLCHRDIIEAMLSQPSKVGTTDLLQRRIMEREWPELLEYPFNRPRGLQSLGMAWMRTRGRIVRKLRKIVGRPADRIPV